MPGSFFGINIASQALRNFEAALNVTGHNLANLNTDGYSRQTVGITPSTPITFFGANPLTMGTGALIGSISRVRDRFVEGRIIQNSADQGRLNQMLSSMRNIEGVFGEPGTGGISDAMSKMFDAWSQLSSNPADEAARLNVRLQSGLFAGRVRETSNQLVDQFMSLQTETNSTISDINRIAAQISDLNGEIRTTMGSGAVPNDLLDQRDLLLNQLSGLVDIRTQQLPDGSMTVFVGQHTLVDQVSDRPLPTSFDAATSTVFNGTETVQIRGGRLAGSLGAINQLQGYRQQLDTLVNEIRNQINSLHQTGTNLNGTTNISIFSGTVGASDLDIDPAIVADLKNIAAGTSNRPGDNGLATALAGLRDSSMANLGGASPTQFFSDLMGRLGQDTNFYAASADSQSAIATQLEAQRQSISGVNQDEELALMLKYQRSYQAAAKVLTVMDQVTDELIRTFGR